jgi:hypothetical protein
MRFGSFSSVAAMTVIASACAGAGGNQRPSDEQIIKNDVARVRAFVEALEACAPEEVAAAVPVESIDPAAGEHGAFRGRLAIGRLICTLMACSDRACCNGCGGNWALSSETPERPHLLKDPTDAQRYAVGATDCSLEGMREVAQDTEIVVRGRFEQVGPDLELAVEDLCRVGNAAR